MSYKHNLQTLEKFVMVKFLKDSMVDPVDSEVSRVHNILIPHSLSQVWIVHRCFLLLVVWILQTWTKQRDLYIAREFSVHRGNQILYISNYNTMFSIQFLRLLCYHCTKASVLA